MIEDQRVRLDKKAIEIIKQLEDYTLEEVRDICAHILINCDCAEIKEQRVI